MSVAEKTTPASEAQKLLIYILLRELDIEYAVAHPLRVALKNDRVSFEEAARTIDILKGDDIDIDSHIE